MKLTFAEQLRAAIQKEATLDIDTTAGTSAGSTEGASGNNPNVPVNTNQTPQDAGADHPSSVDAERLPGELDLEVDKPTTMGESASTVGLFPGTFIRVIERGTEKTVDRGIVQKVVRKEVTLQGGTSYSQDKFKFLRLA